VLDGFRITGSTLALSYLKRAASRLRLADLEGNGVREVALPTIGSLFGLSGEWDGDELYYGFTSYTVPPTVYRLALPAGTTELWRRVDADLDPSRYEVRQVGYPSRDGTEVTMFVVHRCGLPRDGANPVYLSGYGGFNISMTPAFSRSLLLWLERGGVVAIPNIRGGGEYGEEWHRAGMLEKKQNVFDDFIAAAEALVAEGCTSARRIAIEGGSNGGLLVGAVMLQRPELFGAVLCRVPVADMLRYHLFTVGRFWIPEYGSADDPEQFKYLLRYSPYHNVREGVRYPPTLVMTADTDDRVDPGMAKKFAARLQAAGAGGPFLIRVETKAGHGMGKPVSKIIDEEADMLVFLQASIAAASARADA